MSAKLKIDREQSRADTRRSKETTGVRIRVGYLECMPITELSTYVNRFNCVLLPEERGKLQALADDAKLRESEVVRQLIEAAYVERFGKRKPPVVRPKYNSAEARKRNK